MSVEYYEITDSQWEQIKELFPVAKTGRPPKDNRLVFNAILWLARSGSSWRSNNMVHGKLYTAVFVNGVMMVLYYSFLKL